MDYLPARIPGEEIRSSVEEAMAGITAAKTDLVSSDVVAALMRDRALMEETCELYQRFAKEWRPEAERIVLSYQMKGHVFPDEAAELARQNYCALMAGYSIYTNHPSRFVAWAVLEGRFTLLHRVLVHAGHLGDHCPLL